MHDHDQRFKTLLKTFLPEFFALDGEQQRFLLAECVQAYLELGAGAEQEEFERLLANDAFREVKTMGTIGFEH